MNELLGRVPLDALIPTTDEGRFAAECETCAWDGPARGSSLTALADFDRHVAATAHREAVATRGAIELCPECGHAADIHDRRAEDSACDACRSWQVETCGAPVEGTGAKCVRPVGHEGLHRSTASWRGKAKDPR